MRHIASMLRKMLHIVPPASSALAGTIPACLSQKKMDRKLRRKLLLSGLCTPYPKWPGLASRISCAQMPAVTPTSLQNLKCLLTSLNIFNPFQVVVKSSQLLTSLLVKRWHPQQSWPSLSRAVLHIGSANTSNRVHLRMNHKQHKHVDALRHSLDIHVLSRRLNHLKVLKSVQNALPASRSAAPMRRPGGARPARGLRCKCFGVTRVIRSLKVSSNTKKEGNLIQC